MIFHLSVRCETQARCGKNGCDDQGLHDYLS
jgi:hypothetical protein